MARQGPRRYAVLHRYSSSAFGPWEMGTTVELTPAEAEWVNRDSPGTLGEIEAGVKLETGQPVPPEVLKGYIPPDEPEEPEPAEPPAKPAGNASHEAWADYHVALATAAGEDPDEARAGAGELSRDELRDLYREA